MVVVGKVLSHAACRPVVCLSTHVLVIVKVDPVPLLTSRWRQRQACWQGVGNKKAQQGRGMKKHVADRGCVGKGCSPQREGEGRGRGREGGRE